MKEDPDTFVIKKYEEIAWAEQETLLVENLISNNLVFVRDSKPTAAGKNDLLELSLYWKDNFSIKDYSNKIETYPSFVISRWILSGNIKNTFFRHLGKNQYCQIKGATIYKLAFGKIVGYEDLPMSIQEFST